MVGPSKFATSVEAAAAAAASANDTWLPEARIDLGASYIHGCEPGNAAYDLAKVRAFNL